MKCGLSNYLYIAVVCITAAADAAATAAEIVCASGAAVAAAAVAQWLT